MIRKVFAQNYRSIRSLNLELKPFNCLVGANNSGKSNILDIFSFLADVATGGLPSAVGVRGGRGRLRYYGAPPNEPTLVEVNLEASKQIDYTLGFFGGSLGLEREIVNVYSRSGKAETLLSSQHLPSGRIRITWAEGGQERQSEFTLDIVPNSSLFNPSYLGLGDAVPVLKVLRDYIQQFEHFKFVPDRLKSFGPAMHVDRLERDGSNFASYLHQIHSGNKRAFNQIEEQLRKSFPEVEELLTPLSKTQPGSAEVGIKEKWFQDHASGSQLSDGLIGFLAHLVALFGPREPSVAIFEEPENYINPRLLERLVTMLKEVSSHVQVVISTHSTSLLNRLDLDDIILVERREGGTLARPVSDRRDLRKALTEWALGDAYVSGLFDETKNRDSD